MINKVAIITGASRGIGREIALKLAKNKTNIVLAAKSIEENSKLPGTIFSVAKEVNDLGAQALAYALDVRDEDSIEEMVKQTINNFGRIDFVINNAGAIYLTDTEKTTAKQYDLMQSINARATFLVSKACISALKINGGHILNLSPPISFNSKWLSNHVAYSISKFGMSFCTLGMSAELKEFNIAVNSLWPKTLIYTAAIERLMGKEAMLNCRKPSIVADAAYWILSQNPSSFSGNLALDEEILDKSGIKDFSKYNFSSTSNPITDLFIN